MRFVVQFVRGASPETRRYPHVVLVQDTWDDYGYKTTFDAVLNMSADDRVQLGNIKILRFDQRAGFTPMPTEPFEALDENYCSVGGNFAYYEKLFNLGANTYRPYLSALGDVAFDDEKRVRFEDIEGYQVSLMRFSG